MALKISISNNINAVTEFLDELKLRALVSASRKAMNRSVLSLRSEANRIAREERKLKVGEINKDYFKVTKATGHDLSTLRAKLEVSGKPMSLIRFVVGSQGKFSQAGIPVAQRRKIKVEVKPGRKVELQSAFIAMGKGGNFQVFRRRGAERYPLIKQSVPSIASILQREKNRSQLEAFARASFLKEFQHTFAYELQVLQDKKTGKGFSE